MHKIKCTIYNLSICVAFLNTGVFPDRLKYAIVKPIYKKR